MCKSIQCVLVLPQTAPLSAETHSNFVDTCWMMVMQQWNWGWVRETCWKAGGKQRLSKWNLIRLSTLLVSSLFQKREERVDLVFFFNGVYSNAQRVKLFLEPRV